jgi:hypothetical protein
MIFLIFSPIPYICIEQPNEVFHDTEMEQVTNAGFIPLSNNATLTQQGLSQALILPFGILRLRTSVRTCTTFCHLHYSVAQSPTRSSLVAFGRLYR